MAKLLFIVILMVSTVVVCVETTKMPLDNIQITADHMQYDPSNKQAIAKDNVKLIYMVKNMPVTLTANNMTAYFDDSGKLVKVIAEGNVEIAYNGANLYAQTCTHDFDKEQTIGTGPDVKIVKDKDEIHGTMATLDINTQVFTMQTDGQNQITGIIYPTAST